MIEKISNSISAFAIALIYLGYCNLDFYYRNFNIDITKYATSAEILLSFIPVINIILLSVVLSFIFYKIYSSMLFLENYIFKKYCLEKYERILNSYQLFKNKATRKKLTFREKYNAILSFALLPNGIRVLIFWALSWQGISMIRKPLWSYSNSSILEVYIIIGFSLIIIAILELLKIFNFKKFETKIMGVRVSTAIIISVSLISLLFLLNNKDSEYLKSSKIIKHVEFDYNQNHIQTDSLNLYVGEMQEYLFLYNLKNNETSVYSKNAITNIKIGDKTDFNLSENLINLFINK